jgi:carbamoyl-phosphate synthase large subunit
LLGKCLNDVVGEKQRRLANLPYIVLKYPVFSTYKLPGVDPLVGPEMKSTGEGISIAATKEEAATKAFYSYLGKKREAREIYINGEIDESLREQIKEKQLIIVSGVPFSEWVKRKEALAFLDLQKDETSFEYRTIALSRQIMVFTEKETLALFLQAIGVNPFAVSPIQEWLEKKKQMEKAVIV